MASAPSVLEKTAVQPTRVLVSPLDSVEPRDFKMHRRSNIRTWLESTRDLTELLAGKCLGSGRDFLGSLRELAEEVDADVLESRTFDGNEIKFSGHFVDRCVHGDQIIGNRCSRVNQQRIADEFCERQQFERSSGFQTEPRIEVNSIGYFPSNDNFQNVSSADVFTRISCVRPSNP